MSEGFLGKIRIRPNEDIDRDAFPFSLPVFRNFTEMDLSPQVTFFVGENGSGKSTLLEAIATVVGLPAEGGTAMHQFSTFDSHSNMSDFLQISRPKRPKDMIFFRAESFYTFATFYKEQGGRRFQDFHEISHGEGFLHLLSGLKENGLYLMDEPEAALSVQGQITFLGHLKLLVERGSQFIIATHSPIILGFGAGLMYHFSESGIAPTTYRETEHYRLTRDFLLNRERYAKLLGLAPMPEE